MARPREEGLRYFSCVTTFDLDLRSVFITLGAEARSVWLTIMQECYRSGRAEIILNPATVAVLASDSQVTPERFSVIIRGFSDAGIFSLPDLLDSNKVISHGVVKQLAKIEADREAERQRKAKFRLETNYPLENSGKLRNTPLKEKKRKEKKVIIREGEPRVKIVSSIPPALPDIQAYAEGINSGAVPVQHPYMREAALGSVAEFFGHYTSNGWKVGRNRMKDWQQTFQNWLRRAPDFQKNGATQSAYSGVVL